MPRLKSTLWWCAAIGLWPLLDSLGDNSLVRRNLRVPWVAAKKEGGMCKKPGDTNDDVCARKAQLAAAQVVLRCQPAGAGDGPVQRVFVGDRHGRLAVIRVRPVAPLAQ